MSKDARLPGGGSTDDRDGAMSGDGELQQRVDAGGCHDVGPLPWSGRFGDAAAEIYFAAVDGVGGTRIGGQGQLRGHDIDGHDGAGGREPVASTADRPTAPAPKTATLSRFFLGVGVDMNHALS